MTDVWIGACRLASDTYHAVDPEARIGMTNTFRSKSIRGNDYWKVRDPKAGFGWMQEYSEAFQEFRIHSALDNLALLYRQEFPKLWLDRILAPKRIAQHMNHGG